MTELLIHPRYNLVLNDFSRFIFHLLLYQYVRGLQNPV